MGDNYILTHAYPHKTNPHQKFEIQYTVTRPACVWIDDLQLLEWVLFFMILNILTKIKQY